MQKYFKYPRTYHFPWSEGLQNDDKMMENPDQFEGKEVVVTIKMDGENCLDENTILKTDIGYKTVKWICDTKYTGNVWSYNADINTCEWDEIVTHSIHDNKNDWYELEDELGNIIKLTGNHRVWLPELMCYRRVDELKGDEKILICDKKDG